jgi:hypothetical protein
VVCLGEVGQKQRRLALLHFPKLTHTIKILYFLFLYLSLVLQKRITVFFQSNPKNVEKNSFITSCISRIFPAFRCWVEPPPPPEMDKMGKMLTGFRIFPWQTDDQVSLSHVEDVELILCRLNEDLENYSISTSDRKYQEDAVLTVPTLMHSLVS